MSNAYERRGAQLNMEAFTYATTSSASANWQGSTPTVQFLFEPIKP